jgi:TRAP-type C4-dicarboxylate transport system substrate-binding protein
MVGILKLAEVLNTHILPYRDSFGHTPVTHIISRRTFEKFPKEVQKVFLDNFDWASEAISNGEKKNLAGYMKLSQERGNNFIELTADETAQWQAAAKEVHEMWIEKITKKGYPGQKLYDEARRLSKKYTKE